MIESTTQTNQVNCDNSCLVETSVEALNSTCYCLTLDEGALRDSLAENLAVRGLSHSLIESHAHLFASVPMFISREHLEQMGQVIRAIELVVATPLFRRTVLAWAPDIAAFDPRSPGGLLGYDFHLGPTGPQLIEINTNPGGALLNAVLGRSQRLCCIGMTGLVVAPMDHVAVECALFEIFQCEWRLNDKEAPLRSLAIVDEAPAQQYLYPEFLLYQQLFRRHGVEVTICDPGELERRNGQLWHQGRPIDFIYNRLTDFALEQPAHAALQLAYLASEVVVSPHPHAHALFADKRNLTLLCDALFLRQTGISEDIVSTLLTSIPHTEIVTAENKDELWARRRTLFFKPAAGYGSKATYRGDKITKRVWAEISAGSYVAQALVAPSVRHVADGPKATFLKADIRNYAYRGSVILVAARLYQGQTTNFRTPGGGFAPVFTEGQ